MHFIKIIIVISLFLSPFTEFGYSYNNTNYEYEVTYLNSKSKGLFKSKY